MAMLCHAKIARHLLLSFSLAQVLDVASVGLAVEGAEGAVGDVWGDPPQW